MRENHTGESPAIDVVSASHEDRVWAAQVMASSDPWVSLGRGFESCLRSCCDPDFDVYVARRGAERCGVLIMQRRGVAGSPYIVSLAVAPEMRNQRIGSLLLAFAEERVRDHATFLFLCVSSFNSAARRFYERNGYESVAQLDDYVIPGAAETLMCKRLKSA